MSNLQQSDQLTYSFLFVITPIQIISTKVVKNLKKSILLKLGNKTQKTSQLNKPIQMSVQVLYSKTLKKYCPIKGIIKIYDINLDGSEVISSVGGFQTQQILNQQKNNITIQRDVGTFKLKMKIQIKNLGIIKGTLQEQNIPKKQSSAPILSRSRAIENKSNQIKNTSKFEDKTSQKNENIQTIKQKPILQTTNRPIYPFKRNSELSNSTVEMPVKYETLNLKKRGSQVEKIQIQNQNKKPSIQKQKLSQTSISESQKSSFSQNYLRDKQNQELGQQLLQQRRKNAHLEQKNEKCHIKINHLKKKISEHQKQREDALFYYQKLSGGLQLKNGKINIQINQKQKSLSFKYKNRTFQNIFGEFIQFIVNELKKPKIKKSISQLEDDHNFSLYNTQSKSELQFKLLNEELTKKTNQIFSLRTKQRQRGSFEIKLKGKQRQCTQLQNRLKQVQILKKSLKEENKYLKQKDETMQQIISEKQNQIQALKQEITEIELEYKELQSAVKNDGCEIQELKEEVSNLNETIESYRQKYGDLKTVKNRALQNQLKQCLLWIDQQTRQLQMSDFVQDTQPSHSHNVSQIIKNIELEGTSRQEMSSIKYQLAGLIKRIDNFLAK